jgi:hypothetical protein
MDPERTPALNLDPRIPRVTKAAFLLMCTRCGPSVPVQAAVLSNAARRLTGHGGEAIETYLFAPPKDADR